MKTTHIYIYGDIVNFQAEDCDAFGCVSLTTVKNQFQQNPDCEEIIVHVNSCGGDVIEGFAIHDFLIGTGKKITTIVEGLCASIATVVFLAGETRLLTENSRFLIHNPWTFTEGNADELEAIAAQLRIEQEKMLAFYVEKTGGDAVLLQALMNEDILIDAEEALELKFATEIKEAAEAMARVRNSSHQNIILNSIKLKSKMKIETKTKIKATTAKNKTLLGKLKALLSGEEDDAPQAASTDLEDGAQLFHEEDAIAVDVAVFSDAELTTPAPDGDYLLTDGRTATVAEGVVTAIAEAQAETDAEIIARLTSELAAAQATATENEQLAIQASTSLETLQAEVDGILTSGYKPKARTITPAKPVAKKKDAAVIEGAATKESIAEFKAKMAERKAAAKGTKK